MITREVIEASIRSYNEQFATVEQQVRQLDANYAEQRTSLVGTMNQIHGAIVGLNQLLVLIAAEQPQPQPQPQPTEPTTPQE